MIIKNAIDGNSVVNLTEDIAIISSGATSVSTHLKYGVFVNGPLSVSSPPTSVTFGGFYKFNPVAASGMPSTLITPVPTFEVTVPTKNIAIQQSINAVVLNSIMSVF
mgnify:CR=1 FL=1